jgi:peptidoglycan biosynthesis protein MviN/MurJ (putative lipid II flippase)
VLNFTLLFELLRRKIGRLGGGGIARAAGKILVASGIAGAAGWFAASGAAHALGSEGLLERATIVGVGFLAGLLTYLAACVLLRIEEAAPAFLAAARVLGARPKPPAG